MKKISLLLAGILLLFTACNEEPYEGKNLQGNTNLQAGIPDDAQIIDFEEFAPGDIISTINPGDCIGSIELFSVNPDFPDSNAAMAFDSSNPTGGDVDLGTPNDSFGGPGISAEGPQPSNDTELGIVLINSEDLDGSDPDDSYVEGSQHEFDFSGYGMGEVVLYGFDFLDLEGPGAGGDSGLPTMVTLYDATDVVLLQKEIPFLADNSKQFVDLEATVGVAKMVIELNNSGAIDNIALKCEDRKVGGCETMFGKGDENALCFIDDTDNNFNRWGWTNGPLSEGSYTFEIWAGAGQCDTSKGTLAGVVEVNYTNGTAEVKYITNGDHVLQETHLYVGNDLYPLQKRGRDNYVPTVAPGQFPYKHGDLENATMDSYTVEGLSEDIYIIAHGVICELE